MKDQLYEPTPEAAPVRKHVEPGAPKWALPTEVAVGGVLLLAVVIIGSRIADLVLTLMLCGVAYAAGRWRR